MGLTTMAYAAQPEPILPLWTNALSFDAVLSFSSNTGIVTVSILGRPGVTNIITEIRLYYRNTTGAWTEIDKDWNYNVNQMMFSVEESFAGVRGREYKIEVDAYLTKNGVTESISKSHIVTCPNTP